MSVTDSGLLAREIGALADEFGHDRSALLPMLQRVKAHHHGIDSEAMQLIAAELGVHPVEVHSTASFYSFLRAEPQGDYVIRLCRTLSCQMRGMSAVAERLMTELGIGFGETTDDRRFTLEWANCVGTCDQGPSLLLNGTVHTGVTPESVHDIVQACRDAPGDRAPDSPQLADSRRNRLTFAEVEPGSGLTAALGMSRVDTIDVVGASRLKGRGGAGYPTGVKWNFAAAEKRKPKYLICNADEGEPGTFKDRVILTDYPDLVLEGMTIGARAIGATRGIIFLRGEYAYLRDGLEAVIDRRRDAGLLGPDVAGAGFEFDVDVVLGSGAYICGEETALIDALEGFRGEPRNRPPFPVVSGFLGRPSVVNNVETLAWVACIMARGVDWFTSVGTEVSTGHKLFSVSGDCERPGVYEFGWGITVEQLLAEVGGANAKAVQIGGASGRCVPARDFGRQLAFEDIPTGGSVIVIGPHRNLLDVAHNFAEFFVDESCGQCTPCRLGNAAILRCIERLRAGTCDEKQLAEVVSLAETMTVASKCGLGQTSSQGFLTILQGFGDEIAAGLSPAQKGLTS